MLTQVYPERDFFNPIPHTLADNRVPQMEKGNSAPGVRLCRHPIPCNGDVDLVVEQ